MIKANFKRYGKKNRFSLIVFYFDQNVRNPIHWRFHIKSSGNDNV